MGYIQIKKNNTSFLLFIIFRYSFPYLKALFEQGLGDTQSDLL